MSIIMRTVLRLLSLNFSKDELRDNIYVLKHFDEDLLIFTMKKDALDGLDANIIKINNAMRKFFLPDLELNTSGLSSWLKRGLSSKLCMRFFLRYFRKTSCVSHILRRIRYRYPYQFPRAIIAAKYPLRLHSAPYHSVERFYCVGRVYHSSYL